MIAPETIRDVPFFAQLGEEERRQLASLADRRKLRAGETALDEGKPARELMVLVKGLVSFRPQQRSGGEEVAIGTIDASDGVFGIGALVAHDHACTHSALCLEDSEIVAIDGAGLLRLCDEQPRVGLAIHRVLTRILADRLLATREQLRSRIRPGLISHG